MRRYIRGDCIQRSNKLVSFSEQTRILLQIWHEVRKNRNLARNLQTGLELGITRGHVTREQTTWLIMWLKKGREIRNSRIENNPAQKTGGNHVTQKDKTGSEVSDNRKLCCGGRESSWTASAVFWCDENHRWRYRSGAHWRETLEMGTRVWNRKHMFGAGSPLPHTSTQERQHQPRNDNGLFFYHTVASCL